MTSDIGTRQTFPRRDLLEAAPMESPSLKQFQDDELKLLQAINEEIRRGHPGLRAVIDLQFSNPLKVLNDIGDYCRVSFLNKGNRVKSMYTIISNNSNNTLAIGINEPVRIRDTGTQATGVTLATVGNGINFICIPVEIENLELRIQQAIPSARAIVVNGSGAIGANGEIHVYGWTVPEDEDS